MFLSRKLQFLFLFGVVILTILTGFFLSYLIFSDDNYSNNSTGLLPPPFSDRWYFNASLDKSSYFPSDNLTLTVNITCLVSHFVTDYNPGWFRWLYICNSTNDVVWHPFIERPEIIYSTYDFFRGDLLGPLTSVFQIGPTADIPSSYGINLTSFDPDLWDPLLNHWIPSLPFGSYLFIVDLVPVGIAFDSDLPPVLSTSFEIIE